MAEQAKKTGNLIASSIGILILLFCVTIFFSLFNTILAVIQRDLGASLKQLQWMINIYGVFITSSVVIMGRLADLFGRKRMYFISSCLLTLSALGIGFATDPNLIILIEIIIGIGGGIALPVTQAMILDLFKEHHTGHGMSIWAGVAGLSLAFGPFVGGAIVDTLGWRWVFYFTAMILVLGSILTGFFANESKTTKQNQSLDVLGSILLWSSIFSFVFAIIEIQMLPVWITALLFIISACSIIWLIRHEQKVSNPILQFSLLTHGRFLKGAIANGLCLGYVWAGFFLIPYYLQTIFHQSPFQAGIEMLFITMPLGVLSFFVGKWYRKLGPKKLLVWGFVLLMLAAIVQAFVSPQHSIYYLLFANLCFGIGWSFTWGTSMTAALEIVSQDDMALASGTFLTFQEVGGTLGLAIVATIVRWHHKFLFGYQRAMWVLFGMSLIAALISLSIKSKAPMQEV